MSLGLAAAKAGMDEETARKYRSLGQLPDEVKADHDWRTREDPFEDVWTEAEEKLKLIRVWKRRRSLKTCSDGIQVDSVMGNFGPCSVGSRSGVHCRDPPGGVLSSGATNLGVTLRTRQSDDHQ